MRYYSLHPARLENLTIDIDDLFGEYLSKLCTTPSGQFTLTTSLAGWVPKSVVTVRGAGVWSDICMTMCNGLIVSAKVRDAIRTVSRKQVECIPLRVRHKRSRTHPSELFLLNICAVVDAANLTSSGAHHDTMNEQPEIQILNWDRQRTDPVIDPARVPSGKHFFALKYFGTTCISEAAVSLLRSAKVRGLVLDPYPLRREDPRTRSALLSKLKREVRAWKNSAISLANIRTPRQLEKKLGVKLPARAKLYFSTDEHESIDGHDLFNTSDAYKATFELRAWKDLDWSATLVCIADDGRGGYWVIDTGSIRGDDCPVLYFDHELAKIDKRTGRIRPTLELAGRTLNDWLAALKRGGDGLPKYSPKTS